MKLVFFELEQWEIAYLKTKLCDIEAEYYTQPLNSETVKFAQAADGIGVFIYSQVSAALLGKMPQLKFVTSYSTGLDHIDLAACQARNISVTNVPSYGENTVAEHAFALLLALSRKIVTTHDQLRDGDFSLTRLRGFDLQGKVLGIVGLGHIGKHVLRIAKAFEMKVVVCDHHAESNADYQSVSFEELLAQADVVTFHCPLLPTTHHMLNQSNIALCKKGIYIINTARGGLIETEALVKGLASGQIAGAGLDVLEEEQCLIQEEKQLLSSQFDQACMRITLENHVLINHPQVIVTPHNAFNSEEALQRIFKTTIDNVQQFLAANGGLSALRK